MTKTAIDTTTDFSCAFVLKEDEKADDKVSYQQWLHRLAQDKPKIKCKTTAFCIICGYCTEHCTRHVMLRTHLDNFSKPTEWSKMGNDKDRKLTHRTSAYQGRGNTKE